MTRKNQPEQFDAIIIGARVAGSATALRLACAGARILLIDREKSIGDTLSTHALMRAGMAQLERLGIAHALITAGTPIVRQTNITYGREQIQIPHKFSGQISGLLAPRRWLLDAILVDRAVAAGAELRLGTAFETCNFDTNGTVVGVTLRGPDGKTYTARADLVIGADGRNSRVADAVQASTLASSPRGTSSVYGYFEGLENRGYRWFYAPGLHAGAIPTNDGAHCIFVSCKPDDYRNVFGKDVQKGLTDAMARWVPDLAEHMRSTGPTERLTRFGGAPGHIRACTGPGWALVGDAGYFKDQATAHGITDALLDAARLSGSILTGAGTSAYPALRAKHAFDLFTLSSEIGQLDWSLERLKTLHRGLNDAMKRELEAKIPHPDTTMAA